MADAAGDRGIGKGLISREWPTQYRTSYSRSHGRPADMLHDFYIPALSLASRYDRVAGYFRSSSLAAASMGFSSLVNRDGRMRMIVGADLDEADALAILAGDAERLERKLSEELDYARDWPQNVQKGVGLLGWMVGRGFLEVRVAFRVNADTGKPIPYESSEDGYVHEKWLVMTDEWGNRLYASGSLNESRTALQLNAESLDIHCDWWDRRSRERADTAEADFQYMWEGRNPYIKVMSLPEAVRARLVSIGSACPRPVEVDGTSATATRLPDAAELLRFALVRDGPRLPKGRLVGVHTAPVEPWPHQAIVANRLVETWPFSYLLCDEVGLGKTIEAALAFRGLYLSGIAKRILVAAPAGLTAQWQRQMWSKTLLDFGRVTGGAAAAHEWIVPGSQEPEKVQAATIYEPDLTIVSADLMARDQRIAALEQAQPFDIALLDEAHAARRSNPTAGAAAKADPTKLYSVVHDVLRKKAKCLWMATATPMQLHPIEVHDLIAVTDRVGAFQYDPTLNDQYYDILARVQSGSQLTRTYFEFARRAAKAIGWEDPPYWTMLRESLGSRRNMDKIDEWLNEGRIRSDDHSLLARFLFGAGPLSRVMMRHTRPLLEIYRSEGRLTQNLPRRVIRELPALTMNDHERRVYGMLEEYCRGLARQIAEHSNGDSRQLSTGFVLSFFRLRFASSLFALRETAQRRLDKVRETMQHDADNVGIGDGDPEEQEDYDEERDDAEVKRYLKGRSPEDLEWERMKLEELLETIGDLGRPSTKMERLLRELDSRSGPISGRIRQTVIFTRFYDTLADIAAWLQSRRPGILLGCYSGKCCEYFDPERAQMVQTNREDVKERFLRGEIDVLVCTDAAAEGVNLQVADLLVNFDMGWNPMKLEQRIGRIDRIGQKHSVVYVLNLFYVGTAEETVYGRLLSRLASAGLVVGAQQISLLPVEEREFAELADGSLTEDELYERCCKRIADEKAQRARLETAPRELYELYNRMGRTTDDQIPVTLADVWQALQSSAYLKQLGCRRTEAHHGEYLEVGHVPGIPRGTRLTTSRELYDEGIADGGPRLHFATYGDEVFDRLMDHMGQFELPSCIRRISVAPDRLDGVQVVGYIVNCRDAAGAISSRLITSWKQLQAIEIDTRSAVTDQTEEACRRELQRIADEEYALCRSAETIADANRRAAEANRELNHLLIETYLRERRRTDGQTEFWRADADLEERLMTLERMYLSGIPRSRLKEISRYLMFDPGPLDVSDSNPVAVPVVHLWAARDTARRAADALKQRKSKITIDSVLASLKQRSR